MTASLPSFLHQHEQCRPPSDTIAHCPNSRIPSCWNSKEDCKAGNSNKEDSKTADSNNKEDSNSGDSNNNQSRKTGDSNNQEDSWAGD
jgi:hypothetical protein